MFTGEKPFFFFFGGGGGLLSGGISRVSPLCMKPCVSSQYSTAVIASMNKKQLLLATTQVAQ